MSKGSGPRMTLPTQLVLRAMLADPSQEMYGLQICAEAGLPSGTIHPILARLEGLGWLESRWEDASPREEGRPRRRYYALTAGGTEAARTALARATTPISAIAGLRARPAGGLT
jgi:PadR family transcriptional regulator, regulatory protein PadR